MEEKQKFLVEVDGVEKEAEILDVIDYKEGRYAVYSVESGNNMDMYVSEVKKDEEGFDTLVDFDDIEVKKYIIDLIKETLND